MPYIMTIALFLNFFAKKFGMSEKVRTFATEINKLMTP